MQPGMGGGAGLTGAPAGNTPCKGPGPIWVLVIFCLFSTWPHSPMACAPSVQSDECELTSDGSGPDARFLPGHLRSAAGTKHRYVRLSIL